MLRLYYLFFLLPAFSFAQPADWTRYDNVVSLTADTPAALARAVTAELTTEEEKAAALFYWVTHNINYDIAQMEQIVRRKRPRSYTPAEYEQVLRRRVTQTLKKRKGVCDNYARLYQALCQAVGLPCELIVGHARGDVMLPGSLGIGHAWNAVRVNGRWTLVDCTWGAGVVTRETKFRRVFKPAYFAPRPESLSYSHFPNEAEWQLLPNPISEATFLRRPAIGQGFLTHNLYNLSQQTHEVNASAGQPLVLYFDFTTDPGPLFCADYTAERQIDCTVEKTDRRFTVRLPSTEVHDMTLAVLTQRSELLLSYRLTTEADR